MSEERTFDELTASCLDFGWGVKLDCQHRPEKKFCLATINTSDWNCVTSSYGETPQEALSRAVRGMIAMQFPVRDTTPRDAPSGVTGEAA